MTRKRLEPIRFQNAILLWFRTKCRSGQDLVWFPSYYVIYVVIGEVILTRPEVDRSDLTLYLLMFHLFSTNITQTLCFDIKADKNTNNIYLQTKNYSDFPHVYIKYIWFHVGESLQGLRVRI